jgi:hypothetical protein
VSSRRKSSVLSRQKAKRAKAGKRRWLKPIAALIILAAVVSGLGYGWTQAASLWRDAHPIASVPWQVEIKLIAGEALSPDLASDVLGMAKDGLGDGTPSELRDLAEEIQKAGSFSAVHVLRTGPHAAVIQIEPRVPVLCLQLDRLYYVTSKGDAYLPGRNAKIETCPGPVLSGVLGENDPQPSLADDLALELKPDAGSKLRDAVDLLAHAATFGLTPAHIAFEPYRGYSMTMGAAADGTALEVAIGRAPFADRLAKLKDLLDKLAAKQEQAARIELDYQGKAFIKLKKM